MDEAHRGVENAFRRRAINFRREQVRGGQREGAPLAHMIDNRHAPNFDPPWLGFLVIVNGYETDIGLEVAELRVTRPGRPVAGA